jgi:dimethylhistidine N-methyltransferase
MLKSVSLESVQPAHYTKLSAEIESGLLSEAAYISPKFLYDPLGSHLFTAITLLPEYYPTHSEKSIFIQYQAEIAATIRQHGTLIDLGAGNCQKAAFLFPSLKPTTYVAIDFSTQYVQESLTQLQLKFPQIQMSALGMDFSEQLSVPQSVPLAARTFFYPGSSIGNFLPPAAEKLLHEVKNQMADDGGLLIGIDLMKADSVLQAAYDDPLQITAAFNLNILRSVNTQLGSNFDTRDFKHLVKINHHENRVELYLEAQTDLTVSWPNNVRSFKKGELIHTENSHKYTIDTIEQLLHQTGFERLKIWTDPLNYFAVVYAQ